MTRSLDDALADADQRGALHSAHSAERWREYSRRHGQAAAVAWLDQVTGTGRPAGTVMAGRSGYPGRGQPPMAALPATPPPENDPDLYASTARLAEMRRSKPGLVAAAMAEDPNPPRLFGDRDLPLICASPLNPQVLASLPWPLRRPVAEAPTMAIAYSLISKYADAPDLVRMDLMLSPHNLPYIEQFSQWLQGSGRLPADQAPHAGLNAGTGGRDSYSTEQLHAELFAGAPDYPASRARPGRP
jgi:hypothetical protein